MEGSNTAVRIMHGVREVAGQGIYAVQGLRKNGLDAKMITLSLIHI